jgi:hypothetical protein
MWRACEWPRLTLPDAVVRKRFAAPLCVLSFGMMTSLISFQFSVFSFQLSSQPRAAPVAARLLKTEN